MRRRRTGFFAAGFDTALRAVLKASPGLALSEGPRIGPESKPALRQVQGAVSNVELRRAYYSGLHE
jgi:hypothetical protein